MKGKLIVIEGLDGSGKATQAQLLYNRLKKDNDNCKKISFPDYDNPSSILVQMYLHGALADSPEKINAYAASSFYAVDRYASYMQFWKKDYENKATIIADRYTTSNAIYQMVKLERSKWDDFLGWLEDYEYNKLGIPKPEAVIYLDMPIEVSQKLMTERYNGDESKKDLHEKNIKFLHDCSVAALYAAQKLGWNIIHCSEKLKPHTIDDIHTMVYENAKNILI